VAQDPGVAAVPLWWRDTEMMGETEMAQPNYKSSIKPTNPGYRFI
jgi:hypothetical protein